ncbi:HD-GYP domain-containing protein [Sporolactobacillus vineae]|uniref:HD-GYP domain-containing protein n=1 Tax=Sporolactobacillus vineae TaxID=444463 RepID=UPI0002894009|nr:HD domain-containing phosphohydrolase [Sporolactobacillus vineae]
MQLKSGYILKKDVHALSDVPLIPSGTVLSETHIAFLKAFLIDHVEIEPVTADGKRVAPGEPISAVAASPEPDNMAADAPSAYYQYAVTGYHLFFKSWQGGANIDIGKFRKMVIPLFEKNIHDPVWMGDFLLHRKMIRSRADRNLTLGLLAAFLGMKMSLSQGDVNQIGLAGALADCGMARFAPALLNKSGDYIGREQAFYRRHVVDSYKMVKTVPTLKSETMLAVIQHHEREDGSGYPLHLTGDKLSIYGKILAVCDAFLHLAVRRDKTGWPVRTMDQVRSRYYGKLSSYLMDRLFKELMTLLIGMTVELSDGQTGVIIYLSERNPTRPMIRTETGEIFNLENHPLVQIVSVVNQDAD